MISADVDIAGVASLFGRIVTAVRVTPKIAGDVVQSEVRRKTAASVDADNKPFSAYSRIHALKRKKAGLQTVKKDLRFTGKMMDSIHFERDSQGAVVTVGQEFEEIAHGQMFHPRWKPESHSKFLAVGPDAVPLIEEAIAKAFRI